MAVAVKTPEPVACAQSMMAFDGATREQILAEETRLMKKIARWRARTDSAYSLTRNDLGYLEATLKEVRKLL